MQLVTGHRQAVADRAEGLEGFLRGDTLEGDRDLRLPGRVVRGGLDRRRCRWAGLVVPVDRPCQGTVKARKKRLCAGIRTPRFWQGDIDPREGEWYGDSCGSAYL